MIFRRNFPAVIVGLVLFSRYKFDSVKACGFQISRWINYAKLWTTYSVRFIQIHISLCINTTRTAACALIEWFLWTVSKWIFSIYILRHIKKLSQEFSLCVYEWQWMANVTPPFQITAAFRNLSNRNGFFREGDGQKNATIDENNCIEACTASDLRNLGAFVARLQV